MGLVARSDDEEPPAPTYDLAYYAALPRKRVGAGALITDEADSVLVVEPIYKARWEVPGGIVEEGETAHAACVRECQEELGLTLAVGRILVVEHQTGLGERGDSIMFIYDGGVLDPTQQVRLPADELRSYSYVRADELGTCMGFRLTNRLRLALDARNSGDRDRTSERSPSWGERIMRFVCSRRAREGTSGTRRP